MKEQQSKVIFNVLFSESCDFAEFFKIYYLVTIHTCNKIGVYVCYIIRKIPDF